MKLVLKCSFKRIAIEKQPQSNNNKIELAETGKIDTNH